GPQAVAARPESADYRNTLGVAHYRNGDDKAAVAELERTMSLRAGGNSFDWFFLAMAHWRLGDRDKGAVVVRPTCPRHAQAQSARRRAAPLPHRGGSHAGGHCQALSQSIGNIVARSGDGATTLDRCDHPFS